MAKKETMQAIGFRLDKITRAKLEKLTKKNGLHTNSHMIRMLIARDYDRNFKRLPSMKPESE